MLRPQQHGRMWLSVSRPYCKMFRLKPHLATESNKHNLCCGDVAWVRPKGGSNKFQLLSSSATNCVSLAPSAKFLIWLPGTFWLKYSSFAEFLTVCRLICVIYWPVAITLNRLCWFQFRLFIWFLMWPLLKICYLNSTLAFVVFSDLHFFVKVQ